jgi:hypothetical protein
MKEGRYRGREEEVAARTVMKQHERRGSLVACFEREQLGAVHT